MSNQTNESVRKSIGSYLAKRGYKQPIIESLKFVLHFCVVVVFMAGGALIFLVVEDSEVLQSPREVKGKPIAVVNEKFGKENVSVASLNTQDQFWNHLESKYSIQIKRNARRELRLDLCPIKSTKIDTKHHSEIDEAEDMEVSRDSVKDKHFIFMKWFYFVTTCTTTIGYGHVHPRTDEGKLFYIFFSIIGIALMMTLLKKCGSIITGMNRKIISVMRHHLLLKNKYVSDELMSTFCIIFMFVVFMLMVAWHDSEITEASHWSNIDRLYFWIVTFTTVGFGDVHFSITAEVEHMHELLMYRICGLSFLAAIIDSIQIYTHYRNKRLSVRLKKQSAQLLHKIRKRSSSRRSNNSSRSSKNSTFRDIDRITAWQVDTMKSMTENDGQ